MKSLVRWTIGNVHPMGFRVLRMGVESFINLYGDLFDYLIVHNSLDSSQINDIASIGIPLMEAVYAGEIKYQPQDSKWKLYPQRARIETHEIVLDNDIVWFKKLTEINKFLACDDEFLVCDGRKRNLGHYDSNVPKGMRLNSGIVGYPPGFDLTAAINEIINKEKHRYWMHWNDDQGILASIILGGNKKYIQIDTGTVTISYPEYTPATYATHFCGLNKGHERAFNEYINYGGLLNLML